MTNIQNSYCNLRYRFQPTEMTKLFVQMMKMWLKWRILEWIYFTQYPCLQVIINSDYSQSFSFIGFEILVLLKMQKSCNNKNYSFYKMMMNMDLWRIVSGWNLMNSYPYWSWRTFRSSFPKLLATSLQLLMSSEKSMVG